MAEATTPARSNAIYTVLELDGEDEARILSREVEAVSPEDAIRQAAGRRVEVSQRYVAVANRFWNERPVKQQLMLLVGDEIAKVNGAAASELTVG